ncbi:alcohol dehydrogenase GroES-like domain-containing protein, partial [Colletotrichum tamarilloi]
ANINYTKFEPSDSITVFGAGPVKLLFTYLAILYRAFKIYVINYIKKRLILTAFISAIPINFTNKNPIT